jgi:hypothetical protein
VGRFHFSLNGIEWFNLELPCRQFTMTLGICLHEAEPQLRSMVIAQLHKCESRINKSIINPEYSLGVGPRFLPRIDKLAVYQSSVNIATYHRILPQHHQLARCDHPIAIWKANSNTRAPGPTSVVDRETWTCRTFD